MVSTTNRGAHDRACARYDSKIRRQTECNLAYYVRHPEEIGHRLHELDEEWDAERLLDVNGSLAALGGLALSMFRGSRWTMFSAAVLGFGLQRTLKPANTPVRLLRRLGIRMKHEIQEERLALMALRGDLHDLIPPQDLPSSDAARYLLKRVRTLIEQPTDEQDDTDRTEAEPEMHPDDESVPAEVEAEGAPTHRIEDEHEIAEQESSIRDKT